MENNITLSNYESIVFAILKFKTAYELYDDDMVKTVQLLCEDAVNEGNSWIRNRVAPQLRDLLFRSRFQIYRTLDSMFDYYVTRYKNESYAMEETPTRFTAEFKQFTDLGLTENGGPSALKSNRDIIAYCEQAESMLRNGHQILEDAYEKYKATYNQVKDGLVLEDVFKSDEWNQQFDTVVAQLKDPVDATTTLLKAIADRFRKA